MRRLVDAEAYFRPWQAFFADILAIVFEAGFSDYRDYGGRYLGNGQLKTALIECHEPAQPGLFINTISDPFYKRFFRQSFR
jgi:hypothetical protein